MKFKNTFAPNVENKELSIGGIVQLLKHGIVKYSDLPDDVKKEVDKKI